MNLSSSYSDIFSNNSLTISHTRNSSTSPKRIQLKDQIIQQLSSLITLELNKIDSKDIETKLSIYFNLEENPDAKNYIQSLCQNITEIKKTINFKLKNFLNHNINGLIENINNENNNIKTNIISINNDSDITIKNKFKSVLKEIKALNNNSRIKFKKLYDNLSNEYDKILSSVYDYLQKNNTKLVIDRLNRVEQLKNDVLFDVTSIENIQNKFTDSIKNIINKNLGDKLNENINIKNDNKNNNFRHSLGRTKTGYFAFHKNNKNLNLDFNFTNSDNNLYSKLSKNKFNNNMNTISISDFNNGQDENECVKVYKIKLKEKKSEIEKLKQQLRQEKENKNKAINELNKLQYSNKMLLSIKNSQKDLTIGEKFNKLTEMIIGFTYSMNNLRNNLYEKKISHIDAKNIYGKLKTKLISLIEEVSSLKNDLINNTHTKKEELEEDLNDNNSIENNTEIKTIKEENENSIIFTDREKDFNQNNENNNFNNNNINNQTLGNIVNNNITLNTLPNYNIQVLLEENKNLRNQLSQKMLNTTTDNSDKTLIESLKKQILELKKIIREKDVLLEEKSNNSIKSQKEELSNIINNNTKNMEQLKQTYQILIDDKDNRIKELEEEIISYEKEIDEIKEENDKLKSECRKDKILSEAEVNNLKNQKIELQCLLEQKGGNNIFIKDDKEKINKMQNEINIKNKQIILLTQNHENDLKELNLAIEMLKQKILQLEEEKNVLSFEINKDDKNNEKTD